MSDYEDEMDVDLPSKDAVQFSSDNQNAKGKRIAADLPVEAEDNLPWYLPSMRGEKKLVLTLTGSKNIARTRLMMFLATTIFLPRSTNLWRQMYATTSIQALFSPGSLLS
jgi:hypothetical protein